MKRDPLTSPLTWLSTLVFLALGHCCLLPLFTYAGDEVRLWLATPTPTPVALSLDIDRDDAGIAREAYYTWLREQRGLHALPDPDLEDKAYYLAGEAPRLVSNRAWPQWYGLRYAVGPASGEWERYWPGCNPCPPGAACFPLNTATRPSMATATYSGLAAAARVGAAVVWREEQPYLAVVWPGTCPTPPPTPPLTGAGPDGPGW